MITYRCRKFAGSTSESCRSQCLGVMNSLPQPTSSERPVSYDWHNSCGPSHLPAGSERPISYVWGNRCLSCRVLGAILAMCNKFATSAAESWRSQCLGLMNSLPQLASSERLISYVCRNGCLNQLVLAVAMPWCNEFSTTLGEF